MNVAGSSRCAAPALRYGPSGDPAACIRRGAAMPQSLAYWNGSDLGSEIDPYRLIALCVIHIQNFCSSTVWSTYVCSRVPRRTRANSATAAPVELLHS